MKFDQNLLKNVISFENLTKSANQIARFCQIIETGHFFEEIFVKFTPYSHVPYSLAVSHDKDSDDLSVMSPVKDL